LRLLLSLMHSYTPGLYTMGGPHCVTVDFSCYCCQLLLPPVLLVPAYAALKTTPASYNTRLYELTSLIRSLFTNTFRPSLPILLRSTTHIAATIAGSCLLAKQPLGDPHSPL
jgi:hypothetical protein